MKDKLIEVIREVPISKTYEDYVEALADKFVAVMEDVRYGTIMEIYNLLLRQLPVKNPICEGVNNEQR